MSASCPLNLTVSDGNDCVSQSLSIANTGVNTSKLNRMEQFVNNFPMEELILTGEEVHNRLR